ncbi:MAG: hypothetical protein ACYCVH_03090 [Ignavibacteriaceae bacterium]
MNYNVLSIPPFDRQLKRLAKKFPSLKAEYTKFVEDMENNPAQGKPLGNHCYSIDFYPPIGGLFFMSSPPVLWRDIF